MCTTVVPVLHVYMYVYTPACISLLISHQFPSSILKPFFNSLTLFIDASFVARQHRHGKHSVGVPGKKFLLYDWQKKQQPKKNTTTQHIVKTTNQHNTTPPTNNNKPPTHLCKRPAATFLWNFCHGSPTTLCGRRTRTNDCHGPPQK